MNKKFLFWFVLIIWAILTIGIYTTGLLNVPPFHDESEITYTTSGMTKEQVNGLYDYINSLKDYDLPTFVPSLSDNSLFNLDNGNNTYIVELYIDNYEQYGLAIEQRNQSRNIIMLVGFIGGALLVFGGLLGIMPLFLYVYSNNNVFKEGE
jgi:hypothetical protein